VRVSPNVVKPAQKTAKFSVDKNQWLHCTHRKTVILCKASEQNTSVCKQRRWMPDQVRHDGFEGVSVNCRISVHKPPFDQLPNARPHFSPANNPNIVMPDLIWHPASLSRIALQGK